MRKPYIDNLRSCTVVLVVLYHIIYLYNGVQTSGVIGPVADLPWLDAVQYLLYPWFMLILFLLSGMCSRYYLQTHSEREFLRARTRKLLVPSTLGILVFGWVQGILNTVIAGALELVIPLPLPLRWLVLSISGTGVLWTIQVMWVLSLLLVPLLRGEQGRLLALGEKAGLAALLLLGIAVWGSAQILNTPVIPVYRFGIYGAGFLLGYFVFSHERVTDLLQKHAVPLLVAAALLGLAYACLNFGLKYAEPPAVNSPLAIGYAWVMCLALLGCFKRWGSRTGPVSHFAAQKSFGLYVFHYPALSAAGLFLTRRTGLSAGPVYVLSTLAAFGGGLALFELIRRVPGLRWCVLGLKGGPRA